MRTDGTQDGKLIRYEEPRWAPLEAVVADILGDFMWMHEVELKGGRRVQAYKHYLTRSYAHIADDGRAFLYTYNGRYSELPAPKVWGYTAAVWAVLEAARWPHSEAEPFSDEAA